ncbi:helix-turn-helix domain-containing protein [Pseudomonas sp. NPDC047963]|jgi:transcriptional regulator with XRE-family HTH domain|nr:helix-turn-helix domain-containing protein [Pseudomonas sp.]
MESKLAFGTALRLLRKKRGLTQEDFDAVTGRTYLSALERGLKSPTLEKVNELASVLGVHPLSLLSLSYVQGEPSEVMNVLEKLKQELQSLQSPSNQA